ncbi:MAG: acyltransferase family protein [Methylococcaceae bacterium]
MNRISSLDTAKALGMFLVYYGHFIEKLYYAGSSAVFLELKLIYSFHVPLFFFLAGIFWKPDLSSLWSIFTKKFRTRLMPVIFFGLISIPFFLILDKYSVKSLLEKAMLYRLGHPELNWVTWFLVCLFTLELLIAVISKVAPITSKPKALIYAAVLFVTGWLLASNADLLAVQTGVPKNFWFINEAFTAGGFYLLGYWAKELLLKPTQLKQDSLGALIFGLLLLATFNLNNGPFSDPHAIVLMNASSHGNYLLFVMTAIFGIAFVLFTTRCFGLKCYPIDFIAKNTLIYLGLNGLCLFFIDVKVIYKIAYFPKEPLFINLYALAYVVSIMLFFIPVTWLIKKYVPKWLVA